jgi:hypothetical protein
MFSFTGRGFALHGGDEPEYDKHEVWHPEKPEIHTTQPRFSPSSRRLLLFRTCCMAEKSG